MAIAHYAETQGPVAKNNLVQALSLDLAVPVTFITHPRMFCKNKLTELMKVAQSVV